MDEISGKTAHSIELVAVFYVKNTSNVARNITTGLIVETEAI